MFYTARSVILEFVLHCFLWKIFSKFFPRLQICQNTFQNHFKKIKKMFQILIIRKSILTVQIYVTQPKCSVRMINKLLLKIQSDKFIKSLFITEKVRIQRFKQPRLSNWIWIDQKRFFIYSIGQVSQMNQLSLKNTVLQSCQV